jgi:hypothetical protein
MTGGPCPPPESSDPSASPSKGRYVSLDATISSRALVRFKHLDELAARLGPDRWNRRVGLKDLVARIRELTIAANELERRIAAQVGVLAPSVLALPGVGALTTPYR